MNKIKELMSKFVGNDSDEGSPVIEKFKLPKSASESWTEIAKEIKSIVNK